MSYYQIYNEQIRDLLHRETLELEIQELPKGTIITNLVRVQVNSYDEVMEMIDLGNTNRVISQTELNRYSSRSHAIMELTIMKEIKDFPEFNTEGRLTMIDLAGSERYSKR